MYRYFAQVFSSNICIALYADIGARRIILSVASSGASLFEKGGHLGSESFISSCKNATSEGHFTRSLMHVLAGMISCCGGGAPSPSRSKSFPSSGELFSIPLAP